MSSTSSRRRLVVIALDGASPQLLDRWMDDGVMPRLAALRAKGCSAHMESIEGFFVGSTWPSLYTSSNPGRHGFHYQYQVRPGGYALRDMSSEILSKVEPFWDRLSASGKRVCIVDVPLSQLSPEVSGIQIIEWGAHDSLCGFGSVPPGVAADLVDRYGPHPVGPHCDSHREAAADYQRFETQLLAGIEARTRMTLDLLGREQWDFLIQVFSETHCVGHQCWHLHDPAHPAFDKDIAATAGDPIRKVYEAVDDAVGRVADAAGDVTIIIFSSHGMSYWFGADFLLKDILVRLGVASNWPTPMMRRATVGAMSRLLPLWHMLGSFPKRVIKAVISPFRRPSAPESPPRLAVDPGTSRCFPIRNGMALSGIRLNLAGREPAGLIRPGEEAEAFIAQLSEDLLAIKDDRTGQGLIRRILRTRDICDGPQIEGLPDLLVEWADTVPTGSTAVAGGIAADVSISSPKLGTLTGRNEFGRTGEHRRDGMIIAAGPEIRVGQCKRQLSVLDLAPTFCGVLGVDLPDAEGAPVREIVGANDS